VRAVVTDTGPIHYLVLIEKIEILPALFETVVIPSAVRDEMARTEAPPSVRNWIQAPPNWLEVRTDSTVTPPNDESMAGLGDGERSSLALH
jgi:predicted nucleic acid-binding protein